MSRNSGLEFALTERIEGITRSMNRVTYEAVSSVLTRLDEVSPVGNIALWKPKNAKKAVTQGYQPGQFRGNWQLGVNYKPTGWLPGNFDPTGIETVSKNIGLIPTMASRGYKFYIMNNTPYGPALEHGHSTQMPFNMLFRVKREFNQIVRGIVEEIKAEGGRVK